MNDKAVRRKAIELLERTKLHIVDGLLLLRDIEAFLLSAGERLPKGAELIEVAPLAIDIEQAGTGLWRVKLPDGRLVGLSSMDRNRARNNALKALREERECNRSPTL